MDGPTFMISLASILTLFVGLPWLIFHYITQWKKNATLTVEDENLLDELHMLARRLEDRMNTIERIVAADSPSFRPSLRSDSDEEYERLRSREGEPQTSRTRRRDH